MNIHYLLLVPSILLFTQISRNLKNMCRYKDTKIKCKYQHKEHSKVMIQNVFPSIEGEVHLLGKGIAEGNCIPIVHQDIKIFTMDIWL